MFLYLYVIETKGRTLEETAALFDGVDATTLITSPGRLDAYPGEGKKSIEKDSTSDVAHLESTPHV